MRVVAALAVAIVALAGARFARLGALAQAPPTNIAPRVPFAPSVATAPFVSLGYREALADVLYVRMIGYFNGKDSLGAAVGDLAEAVATLDPDFERVYDYGANAMTLAKFGVDQSVFLRAIALLEKGSRRFPENWRLPYLAGQIYAQDLTTENPAEQRVWDERATLLIESAIRKPGAPTRAASWAAMMRTKLGQHERAVANLKEMALVTSDMAERRRLIGLIQQLEVEDGAAIAAEIEEQRNAFEARRKAERPMISTTMYVLLGAPPRAGFDMGDLASGGRDLHVPEPKEPLEPLE